LERWILVLEIAASECNRLGTIGASLGLLNIDEAVVKESGRDRL
jgi:hypothetical protein